MVSRIAPPARAKAPRGASGSQLQALRRAAADCTACPLWKNATQTVFGAGPARAGIMLVGEQPGDQEDVSGEPFIGPAGKMLNKALAEAGIERTNLYVTNAVKHFKFEQRGKRRLHKKPADAEIEACLQWLTRELALVDPQVVVALGATAARALLGRSTPIGVNRGKPRDFGDGRTLFITVHPSFLLRVPQPARDSEYKNFVEDLKLVAKAART
jgi:uracil-DNA glycosylase family protein